VIDSPEQVIDHPLHPFIARFKGVELTKMPDDLYIPPEALEIFLDAFEGPLDLLLYLIRKNNMDILNIQVAEVTLQYIQYVELMKNIRLELAADYLVMAAMLTEIKSRMLLPRAASVEEEADPRAELIRRLQEYERFKKAAEEIELLPRLGRDVFTQEVEVPTIVVPTAPPEISMKELLDAFLDVLKRSDLIATHKVHQEPLSVRERMSRVLDKINSQRSMPFQACFDLSEGRIGVVVSFLAILELLRLGLIDIIQTIAFGPIYLKSAMTQENSFENPPSLEEAIAHGHIETVEPTQEVEGIEQIEEYEPAQELEQSEGSSSTTCTADQEESSDQDQSTERADSTKENIEEAVQEAERTDELVRTSTIG
jgi:segregation and condensation protein A